MVYVNRSKLALVTKNLDLEMPKVLKAFAKESVSELVIVNVKRLRTFLNRRGKDISSQALTESLYRHQGYKGLKIYNRTSKGIDYCLRKSDIIEKKLIEYAEEYIKII